MSHSKWNLAASIIFILTQACLYLLLPRFIDTTSLGHYFLVSAVIFIPTSIIEYCFNSSLIHHQDLTQQDYISVRWLNLSLASISWILGGITAYLISISYDIPHLFFWFLCLSPILFLSAIASALQASLRKDLKIKKLASIDFTTNALLFAVSIMLLLQGYGVIALIIGMLTKYFSLFVLTEMLTDYTTWTQIKPNPLWRKHFQYGKFIISEKAVAAVLAYADSFLIHHFLGAGALGIYELLKRIVLRPIIVVYNSIEQIVFPLLSEKKSSTKAYNQVYDGFAKILHLFIFLFIIGFIIAPIGLTFFPENYQNSQVILQLICLLGASIIVFNPVDILAYSKGLTKPYFYWNLAYGLIQIGLMIFSLKYGIETFVMTVIACYTLGYILSYSVLFSKNKVLEMKTYFKPVTSFAFQLIGLAFAFKVIDGFIWQIIVVAAVGLLSYKLIWKSNRKLTQS